MTRASQAEVTACAEVMERKKATGREEWEAMKRGPEWDRQGLRPGQAFVLTTVHGAEI